MSDISKNELMSLLRTHEKRETKEQEAAESKEEQRLEDKAGIHEKHAKSSGRAGTVLDGFDEDSKKNPGIPASMVQQWRKELKARDTKEKLDYLDGVEHSMEMEKAWQSSRTKTAFWRGFERRGSQ